MTTLLKKAIEAVGELPDDVQDRIAIRILEVVDTESGRNVPSDWAWEAIRHATGTATSELTTDEILELTRGDG